jgi:hypothetical protein
VFSSEENEIAVTQTALTHSQSWIELHTNQRQNLLNFFLIAAAFLVNAYVGALSDRHYILAGFIGLLGAAISVAFMLMDLRNRDLTRAGEVAVRDIEARLANTYNMPTLRIMEAIDKPRRPWLSIGKLVRAVHATVGLVFLGTAIYAFVIA